MKYIPIPDPRSGAVTPAMLADLKTRGIIPASVGAFASAQHWWDAAGFSPPLQGEGAKYWRDNAAVWRSDELFDYLMLDRNPDGSYVKLSLTDPKTFQDGALGFFGIHVVNFYRLYAAHIEFIPRISNRSYSREDAARLNFGPGVPLDYPIGIGAFPTNMALRINPATGGAEAFYFDEYVREFPLDWTPVVKTANRLSDEELVGAVSSVLGSNLPVARKATAIRTLAGVK